MKKVGVTGATGFVGKRLLWYDRDKYALAALPLREKSPASLDLTGMDVIVHLAGKAHVMGTIDDSVYFEVNYTLTRQLAERAKEQGVRQFVYISSTKVYDDHSKGILNEQSPCLPNDAYGKSKLEAEKYLQSLQDDSFTVAIVRPPLVYGPEVKGNVIRLLHLADKRIPLPFGNTRNARSMVYVDNLVELINTIIERRAGGVFVAGDATPVSTDQLLTLMRQYLGRRKGLITVPGLLRTVIRKFKPALHARLFGSFVVDNRTTNELLHFTPPYSTAQGVEQMVNWYKMQHQ